MVEVFMVASWAALAPLGVKLARTRARNRIKTALGREANRNILNFRCVVDLALKYLS